VGVEDERLHEKRALAGWLPDRYRRRFERTADLFHRGGPEGHAAWLNRHVGCKLVRLKVAGGYKRWHNPLVDTTGSSVMHP
jgi:hypothetical protein